VDRAVIAAAARLFAASEFPAAVALCSDALHHEPECVPLLMIRARARIALRRNLDAQADLREVVRLDPDCDVAYRLLGELAAPIGLPRFGRGTEVPGDDDPPTQPFTRPSEIQLAAAGRRPPARIAGTPALPGRALPPGPAKPALRSAIVEPPGFAEYLVATGLLSRERLRAAQAYQRSMKVQLSTAIVTLGLVTPQRLEWAAVTHRSQLAGSLN
jgi:hypothetical protein